MSPLGSTERSLTPSDVAAAGASTGSSTAEPGRWEVELDIFSGMPNPTWILTNAEADSFITSLGELPRTPGRGLSGNLGYRGFIVQRTQGDDPFVVHIQAGIVQIASGPENVYVRDQDRRLERWLLDTGRPYVQNDVFALVEREVGERGP